MAFEDQRTTVYKIDPAHPESETLPTLRTEELLLNMGPQHPATHGVLKVILELEGERLVKSTPVLGFCTAAWRSSRKTAPITNLFPIPTGSTMSARCTTILRTAARSKNS